MPNVGGTKPKKRVLLEDSTKPQFELTDNENKETDSDEVVVKLPKTTHGKLTSNKELEALPLEIKAGSSRKKRRKKQPKNEGKISKEPKTIITTVLEELQEDIVDDLALNETGEYSSLDVTSPMNHGIPSNKVYVQHKHGFIAVPRNKILQTHEALKVKNEDFFTAWNLASTPLEIAIFIQKCFKPFYVLCHGLLGGLALSHCILAFTAGNTVDTMNNFLVVYSQYAQIIQTMFYFLSSICTISVFDRFDLAQLDLMHVGDLIKYQLGGVMTLLVYLSTLILTLITTKWDDRLALYQCNDTFWSDSQNVMSAVSMWKNLNLCRCLGAVAGWICMVFLNSQDSFHLHLVNMLKYQHHAEVEQSRF